MKRKKKIEQKDKKNKIKLILFVTVFLFCCLSINDDIYELVLGTVITYL